jgi:hypothetical protein
MNLLNNSQKIIKSGFYLDYFFKNIFMLIYKIIFKSNFIYLIDKYLAEKFFFFIKNFFSYFFFINEFIKKTETPKIIKILLIIIIQLLIIVLL